MGKIAWVVVIFLVLGGYLIYSNLKTDFSNPDNVKSFVGAVTGWVVQLGESSYEVGKTAIEQKWLPENATFSLDEGEN